MSQQKVDKYKEYKKNRKQIIAKEKRTALLHKMVAWSVVALIIIGLGAAIGVTLYNQHQEYLAGLPSYKAESFMLGDMAGIREEETSSEDETSSEETTGAEETTEASSEETTGAEESTSLEETTEAESTAAE